MMMITRKPISRRTVLRGAGTALALPFLEAMMPPLSATVAPTRRLGVIYVPNGMVMQNWTPKNDGTGYELSPILSPLEPFREKFLVVSGLANRQADSLGDGSGDHARGSGGYLTGIHVKRSEGIVEGGISMDQLAARAFESETQLSSLELSLDANDVVGSCDFGYSCAYTNTISWRTPTMPLPAENDPRAVFERLFGATDSTESSVRLTRLRRNRSILDFVVERVTTLQRDLGAGDQRRLSDYMEAIRDVERRVVKAEQQEEANPALIPGVDRPSGIPDTFEEHARLMFDLQVLAYQCDLTRVTTLMLGRELSPRTYPHLGIPDAHHGLSHHADDPEKLAKLTLLQTHHVRQLAYLIEKLATTPDGDATLLDHVMLTYGGGLSNSDRHYHFDLPLLLIGGGGGFKGGRHVRLPEDTPMANLHLTILEKLGVRMDRLGDATGTLNGLSTL